MKKAFITVEAVIFIGIIFLLFIMSYTIYIDKMTDLSRARQELQEKNDCMRTAAALSVLHVLGAGAKTTVTVQHHLKIEPAQQRIEMNHTFCTFPAARIFGDGSTVPFTVLPGNFTITQHDSYGEVIQ